MEERRQEPGIRLRIAEDSLHFSLHMRRRSVPLLLPTVPCFRSPVLPLHPTGGVAAHESDDLVAGDVVEVAVHAMLEATGCDGEGDGVVRRAEVRIIESVKQAGRERIAATDAIDDVANLVRLVLPCPAQRRQE